jgi:septum formation protein
MRPPVILASGSDTRRRMLTAAGVAVDIEVPAVDEAEVKTALRAAGATPQEVAEALADLKATRVSRRRPDALVIGADQMLDCEGVWFDKPDDMATAREQLRALRGRRHRLVSAVVVAREGRRIWHAVDEACLTMRPFSEHFLAAYLDAVGAEACRSVGAYQLEGRGAQLFNRVEGDYFTILGLPLLPLLEFLRNWMVVDH